MKSHLLTKNTLMLCVLSILLYSCQKKAEVDTETQTAVDNTIAETAFTQVYPNVSEITVNEPGVRAINNSCASYELIGDTSTFPATPLTIVISYDSTAGCLDGDGRFKKGKLTVVYTEKWDVVGSTISITLDDYYVDNINYTGTVIVTNNGNHSFTTQVVDGKCITADWLIEYASNSTVEQIAGEATPGDALDDVFKFTGTSSGVNRKGRKFTNKIITPLIKKASCSWIDTGIMEITPEGLATRSVNFGDGACNNDAVVTINGNNYDIKLK